ncbi:MAG: ribosome assembly cofactor RimP [Bacteroidales bacterium]|nr:ribosome assembly cofactor RimP [Bacteroidales bacterium]MDD2425062.1 ribosome assembly cofactor RimP [Bacteroidales bacterium]MDD3988629.1 ribosome assembly cofactor RimP [Bacteroidales bacterium]
MIDKEQINHLINNYLEENKLFLVGIDTDSENNVEVIIESTDSSVNLDDCSALSRLIEQGLDREKEDYSLTVTSAGLDRPFRVPEQYRKYCGRDVEIVMKGGEKLTAEILSVCDTGIEISYEKLIKRDGKKKREKTEIRQLINFSDLKSVRPKIKI